MASSTSNSHIDATKEQHVAWLASIVVSISDTKDDVITRVNKFKKCPNLVEKLKKNAKSTYKFPTAEIIKGGFWHSLPLFDHFCGASNAIDVN